MTIFTESERSAASSNPSLKPVTALICTRNRGASLVPTVRSILASRHPDFELIIVDQSPGDDTKNAVAAFLSDAHVRYLHVPTMSGLGRARNLGIREAHNDIVVMTDDDVEVPPDWLPVMQTIFEENPNVAVAFCNVDAPPHDTTAGFIPQYARTGDLLLTRVKDKVKARGIGAGMAVRRSLIEKIGGYDEMLGAGAPYFSCEDGDMASRALLLGYYVYETDRVSVVHFGYRRNDEGRALTQRDWFGIGASYAKPLKAGYWQFASVPAYEFFRFALWPPVSCLLRLKKPVGVSRCVYFVKGFLKAWRTPLDTKHLVFVPPSGLPKGGSLSSSAAPSAPEKASKPYA